MNWDTAVEMKNRSDTIKAADMNLTRLHSKYFVFKTTEVNCEDLLSQRKPVKWSVVIENIEEMQEQWGCWLKFLRVFATSS